LIRESEETITARQPNLHRSNAITGENLVLFDEVHETETVLALFEPTDYAGKICAETVNATDNDAEISGWKGIEESVEALGRLSSFTDRALRDILILRLSEGFTIDGRKDAGQGFV
jgi:hypothetical protein